MPAAFSFVPHTAIVVAGGQGARLGHRIPKAFVPIAQRPMVLYSIATLAAIESISTLIVAVPAGYEPVMQELLQTAGPWRVTLHVVRGGAERHDSVAAGLAVVGPDTDLVLIHDAARPFVRREQILACLAAAQESGAALLALPAHDTIKLASTAGTVVETIDRQRVWLAQTPQAFRRVLLLEAYARLRRDLLPVTDDAMLIERTGGTVRLVAGDADNRKITTAADLRWAEWYSQLPQAG